jgi:enamine deaminase RidA (YjgF/YER057c/UK114 family)
LQFQQSQVTTWINTSWPSLCGSLSCGQGDATNQLNSALGNLNTTFASINTAVSTLQIDVVALTTACESLTDALLVVSDQFSLVAGQIADSKGYPAGAIAELHLDIAMSEWNQLQQYVEQNLT